MKKSKVLLTLIMAAVMILTVVLPVFAAETYTITINNETAGHKYEAYQIFLGEVFTDEETGDLVLSSITWGSGVTETGKTTLGNAQDLADTLKTTADAEAFAKVVAPYLTSTCSKATYNATDKNYTISDLPAGYYLIKDEDNSLADEEGYTAYILKVVGDTEADPKDGETTFEKKVDDKNDSTTEPDTPVVPDTPETPDEPYVPVDGNYFTNGAFETGNADGWKLYGSTKVDAAAAKTGGYGLHIKGTGDWGGLGNQTISGLEIGKTYRISL